MEHLKIIGLALVAAAAFMAFAGSASASPTLTSPAGTAYTGTFTASAGSSLLLKATFSNVTCTESTVGGEVTTNNETEASGPIKTLTFGNCGSNDPVLTTIGSVVFKRNGDTIYKNLVFSVTNTSLGVTCAYGPGASTQIGTLTQSPTNTTAATLDINASLSYISAHSTGSAFICGNGTWSGSYEVTKPIPLFLA